jgi:hypothetical protein
MTAQSQIQDLVRHHAGKHADTVAFVDQLLGLVEVGGEIRCTLAGADRLRFELSDQETFEIPLDRAKAKLRAACARLGVLCNESGGQDVSLYGGEGIITKVAHGAKQPSGAAPYPPRPDADGNGHVMKRDATGQGTETSCSGPRRWAVRFSNTPSRQEFTIAAK